MVALGRGGFQVKAAGAHELICGYACGLAKDVEDGSVMSPVVPMPGAVIEQGIIALQGTLGATGCARELGGVMQRSKGGRRPGE